MLSKQCGAANAPEDEFHGRCSRRHYRRAAGALLRLDSRDLRRPPSVGEHRALETFRDLCRQVFSLGNERSTILFIEKFVALLPAEARRRILIEFFAERNEMEQRSPEDNARRKENLLSPKKIVS